MRILLRLHRATIGGSQRSFHQLARLLTDHGHHVEFCGDGGEWLRDGKFAGFVYHRIPYHPFSLRAVSSARRIYSLLRRGEFDVVQVNGAYLGLETALPAALAATPVIVTLPGGRLPLLPTAPFHHVACFSRELEDALNRQRSDRERRVWMVGNRIDCAEIRERGEDGNDAPSGWLEDGPSRFLLSMTTRMDPGKERAVAHCLQAARHLRGTRGDFRFLLIGGGPHLERYRRQAAELNREAGEDYLHFAGPLENPFPVVRRADVVLGVGLSALEGGVFDKPCLIVGENGYAGTLAAGQTDALEYYNYSGRNAKQPVPPEDLSRELNRILEDGELRSNLGRFAREFVISHQALASARPLYEELYRCAAEGRPGRPAESLRAAAYVAKVVLRLIFRRRRGDVAEDAANGKEKSP